VAALSRDLTSTAGARRAHRAGIRARAFRCSTHPIDGAPFAPNNPARTCAARDSRTRHAPWRGMPGARAAGSGATQCAQGAVAMLRCGHR